MREHDTQTTESTDSNERTDSAPAATVPVRRRTLLRTVGASTAATTLAGCFGSSDNGNGGNGTVEPDEDENAIDREFAGAEPCTVGSIPDGDPTTTIDDDITTELTLEAGLHRVTDHVEIEGGGTLTIEPGATVIFEKDAGFIVRTEGTLTAVGTCEEPILMTGDEAIRGYWHGLFFDNSMKTDNRLEYAVVEYGGNTEANSYSEEPNAAVGLYGESYVSIDQCTLRESPRYGLRYGPNATLASCEQNAFTRNADAAVMTRATGAHYLDASSTYTGNGTDRIRVMGGWGSGYGGRVAENQSVTWQNLDVHYHVVPTGVNGQFDVLGELTVEPETRIVFSQDTLMRALDGGSIALDGGDPAQVDPITLTSENESRGDWNGLFYDNTNANANVVRNAVLEYGGGGSLRDNPSAANLVVSNGSRVDVEDATIRHSGGYGMSTDHWVTIDVFEGNAVTGNAHGPVYTSTSAAHFLTPSNTYTGNDVDVITMRGGYNPHADGGGTIPEEADVTWQPLDVDYLVIDIGLGTNTYVEGDLTIDPGTTVMFAEDFFLEARGSGSINAEGTPDEPITFTGKEQSPGYWGGILYTNTNHTRNVLRNVIVEYGGAIKPDTTMDHPANVSAIDGAAATVVDSTIRHSGGFGLGVQYPKHYEEERSQLTTSGNTFENNAMGSSYIDEWPFGDG